MADTKEWTLMFYFASDNPLAPGIVTQLKALKQAGFHPDVNVVVQFDPQTEGTPTHIFDVNLVNKLKSNGRPDIGFSGNDPYVRTLMEDKLWREQKGRNGTDQIRDLLKQTLAAKGVAYDPPIPPPDRSMNGVAVPKPPRAADSRARPEPGPKESLSTFLTFCSDNYRAKNYMLFILGHGIAVGNDIFLFDEHVDSDQHSLSLIDLGGVLKGFAQQVRDQGAEFQLVSFHSCSVSSLEVAYELQENLGGRLKGTANYMLASQGPAFVGSWPYREIVIRVLNDVNSLKEQGTPINVKEMLVRIFNYVLHNSSDFILAGYPFQLTLCDLNKVAEVTAPLKTLSDDLFDGLADSTVRNLILLAHWKSISYWGEKYTDLYDFCFCLSNYCEEFGSQTGGMSGMVATIHKDCGDVLDQLTAGVDGNDDRLIVRADFAGPGYQYSHGLSVFFPWTSPLDNFMKTYEEYGFKITSWNEFLKSYFVKTERNPRRAEADTRTRAATQNAEERLEEDIASICFNNEGPLNMPGALNTLSRKVDPKDPTGDDCDCGTIKNYPHDTRPRPERDKKPLDGLLPIGPNAFDLFQ
ncbi:MAG: clostripain-related cysteine peptidase [Pyrinomonadaceae bacterium]